MLRRLSVLLRVAFPDYKSYCLPNHFPLHIPLDDRTKTTGVILCEHIKALDLNSRTYQIIENLPKDILENVIDVVYSEIEQIED